MGTGDYICVSLWVLPLPRLSSIWSNCH